MQASFCSSLNYKSQFIFNLLISVSLLIDTLETIPVRIAGTVNGIGSDDLSAPVRQCWYFCQECEKFAGWDVEDLRICALWCKETNGTIRSSECQTLYELAVGRQTIATTSPTVLPNTTTPYEIISKAIMTTSSVSTSLEFLIVNDTTEEESMQDFNLTIPIEFNDGNITFNTTEETENSSVEEIDLSQSTLQPWKTEESDAKFDFTSFSSLVHDLKSKDDVTLSLQNP